MKIQRAKGMRDLSPGDMAAFRYIEKIYYECFNSWGYREVRTPTIEYLHLFTSAGTLTPGRLGKVYSFLDWDGWSGERVVLRPDGTIPVARLYTEYFQNGLARLFYAANTFIFEEAGEKSRERWQCGAELIGAGAAIADTELVALSLEILNKLGLHNVEVRLSHAGLIKVLLEKLGLSPEEQHRMLDRILDGDAEALARLSKATPEAAPTLQPLLSLNGKSTGFLRNQRAALARSLPEIKRPLDDFLQTVALLDELGLKYRINIASGAGFEYYTGLIFQLFIGREKVGGGGRYDALIPSMGGGEVPACGFALYVDRLMDFMKAGPGSSLVREQVLVRAIAHETLKEAFKIAEGLRRAGYVAVFDIGGQKPETRWTLEVMGKGRGFILIDKEKPGKVKFQALADVLKNLEAEVGN